MLDLAARPDRSDRSTLDDLGSTVHAGDPQMGQGHRIAVGGLDRDHPAADGHGSRKRDGAAGRRRHCLAGGSSDVDPAMLPGRVRIVTERESLQQRSVHRPGPCLSCRREDKCSHDGRKQWPGIPAVRCLSCQHIWRRGYLQCRSLSIWTTTTCRKGLSSTRRSGARRPPSHVVGRSRQRRAPPPRRPRLREPLLDELRPGRAPG
jgi:hypothetical protein